MIKTGAIDGWGPRIQRIEARAKRDEDLGLVVPQAGDCTLTMVENPIGG